MNERYACEGCGREFDRESSRYSHQARCSYYLKIKKQRDEEIKKTENSYDYECICGRKFPTIGSMRSHHRFCEIYQNDKKRKLEEQENQSKSTEFICEDCGKEFRSSQSRAAHYLHCKKHMYRLGKEPITGFRGHEGWSKGKTKDDPVYGESIRKVSEANSKRLKELGKENNPLAIWAKTADRSEAFKKQSETLREKYKLGELTPAMGVGKEKYSIFIHNNKEFVLRSTYEFIYALYMADHDIDFEYESVRIDEGDSTYFPDFLVGDTIIEVRGQDDLYSPEEHRKYVEDEGYDYVIVGGEEILRIRDELNEKYDMENLIKCIYEGHDSKNLFEFDYENKNKFLT